MGWEHLGLGGHPISSSDFSKKRGNLYLATPDSVCFATIDLREGEVVILQGIIINLVLYIDIFLSPLRELAV